MSYLWNTVEWTNKIKVKYSNLNCPQSSCQTHKTLACNLYVWPLLKLYNHTLLTEGSSIMISFGASSNQRIGTQVITVTWGNNHASGTKILAQNQGATHWLWIVFPANLNLKLQLYKLNYCLLLKAPETKIWCHVYYYCTQGNVYIYGKTLLPENVFHTCRVYCSSLYKTKFI